MICEVKCCRALTGGGSIGGAVDVPEGCVPVAGTGRGTH